MLPADDSGSVTGQLATADGSHHISKRQDVKIADRNGPDAAFGCGHPGRKL